MKLSSAILVCILAMPAAADEGMWPFNQFPKDAVRQKHKFEVTEWFLNNLRLASVQVGGGSGSFVSPNGLVLTNQHIIAGCIADVKIGFYAPDRAAETRCPHLEAAVLVKIDDVTAPVKAATPDTLEQRNAVIAKLEKACAARTHDRCTVVKLFSGGRYDLYQYKTYDDVRMVFAPEQDLAFFGRERDAITYLRYGLDIAFLRVYENGQPAATPHYLSWSAEAVQEGDLVFSAGNPGQTMRLSTAAQLKFYRDTALPIALARLQPRIKLLASIPAAEPVFTAYLNSYKVAAGKLIGLRDDRLVGRKTNFEGKVRRTVERDPKLGTEAGKVWDQVATAYKTWTPFEKQYQILTDAPKGSSPPNEAVDTLLVTQYLEELKQLGEKMAPVKAALGGKTPQLAAEAYVKSGRIGDLAKLLEEPARKIRKKHDDLIGSLETSATGKIAQYRFRLFGEAEYPDATSTPRVEFGVVKGYTDRANVLMPYAATFGGLYYRKNDLGPYQVPQRWVDAKRVLIQVTPLDFVSTCDIGGGDYGGPTVNRAGKLVGVTFDGNLESLPDVYLYSDEQARAVHVAVQGIAEALDKVYNAAPLLGELGWKVQPAVSSARTGQLKQIVRE
jgi:Peptidase S46